RRHAGEILEQHPRRREANFDVRLRLRVPLRQCLNVLATNRQAVLVTKQVFEKDLEREWQATDIWKRRLERRQTMKRVSLSAHREGRSRAEAVCHVNLRRRV